VNALTEPHDARVAVRGQPRGVRSGASSKSNLLIKALDQDKGTRPTRPSPPDGQWRADLASTAWRARREAHEAAAVLAAAAAMVTPEHASDEESAGPRIDGTDGP
jgi:hypothetical protein